MKALFPSQAGCLPGLCRTARARQSCAKRAARRPPCARRGAPGSKAPPARRFPALRAAWAVRICEADEETVGFAYWSLFAIAPWHSPSDAALKLHPACERHCDCRPPAIHHRFYDHLNHLTVIDFCENRHRSVLKTPRFWGDRSAHALLEEKIALLGGILQEARAICQSLRPGATARFCGSTACQGA